MSIACVFPGQGSQAVGMLDSLAESPAVAALLQSADAALGESISSLIASGPAEQLALTVNTQPAMLVAGLGCYRAWLEAGGPAASMVAGHSLGEYTAMVAADVLDAAEAVSLVRLRARAMQEAVPVGTGAMAAILGLDDEKVAQACRDAVGDTAEVVAPANFNAPAQVVIAGHVAAVERACVAAKALGAKRALPLPVSAPFHSSLLEPAGRRLAEALDGLTLRAPTVPLVNNVDVAVESDPARIRDALIRQAYSPVRWVEVVRKLRELGATRVIEFGPGKVLAGLVGRIEREMPVHAVYDRASLEKVMEECSR
ncbi:MAG: ACP S-malonyltransferase [Burkholderiaceae bacterium]|nr:ACP S-malonyltransferase [Burkholderiaceae bacterium]